MSSLSLPRVTIITPSFNQGRYLEETICSVLDQGYANLEFFVVDGGSTDDSVEIIRKYARHLTWWVSEPDRGQTHAIAKGYHRSSGDVINWINSDDYLAPGALKAIANAFQDLSVQVYCGTSRIFGNGVERASRGTDVYDGNLEKTIGLARIDQPETWFRKAAWDLIGGVDERYHYLMDRDLWVRYLLAHGLVGIKKDDICLANFRLHPASKTVSQQSKFAHESAVLFASLAAAMGLDSESQEIMRLYHCTPKSMRIVHDYGKPNQIMNYFFWGQAQEKYLTNAYDELDAVVRLIKPDVLTIAERESLTSIMRRRRYLPTSIKRGYHHLRAKLGWFQPE